MKKQLLKPIALATALLIGAGGAYAQRIGYKPFKREAATQMVPKTSKSRAQANVPYELVVEEHFSKFTAGTEENPDKTNLRIDDYYYELKPEYLETPGWTGNAVWQAGGSCYLGSYYDEYYQENSLGYLSTKEMALYGDVRVTFRAKRAASAPEATHLWLALCDNYSGPVDSKEYPLTTEWQSFEFTSNAATFNDYNIFQFTAYEGEMLIDDIKIERAKTKIAAPAANPAINNSSTSFTASWSKVADATDYLLTVYYKDYPAERIPATTVTQDFDGINATNGKIDQSNPGYPEGWNIDVSTVGDVDVMTETGKFSSGKQSIVLGEEGDYITTPVTPAPITKISFWCRPSSMESEDYMSLSMIGIDFLVDGEWVRHANMPNYYFTESGGEWSMEIPAIRENATQLKISYIQQGKVKFYIDDLSYTYETQKVPVNVFEDKAVVDTFYTVEKYDNRFEHYYTVKARNEAAMSDATYPTWVDGLNGVKPVALPATDVTDNSFTANWEGIVTAETWKVNTNKLIEGNGEEVVLLYENFDRIDKGTIAYPVTSYTSPESLAQLGYTDSDWMLQLPQYANGMAGAQATNYWLGQAGLVVSPRMNLDDDGGKGAFNVWFKAYMTDATDEMCVYLIKEYNSTVGVAGLLVPFEGTEPGMMEGTARYTDKSSTGMSYKGLKIAFMSKNGQPFFIDEVKVTQVLNAGESTFVPYRTAFTEGGTSYSFENLDAANKYSYSVSASTYKDYVSYASDESDAIIVSMPAGIEDVMVDDANEPVKYFNLQGVQITNPEGGVFIRVQGNKATKVLVK